MVRSVLRCSLILLFLVAGPVTALGNAADEARQGLDEILDLWRVENYEALFTHLEYPPGQGWDYFAERIVYGSRLPACCWERLQDVKVTVLDADHVVIGARLGLEVEGVGTRFVTREFALHRSGGVWKLPLQVVLDLSDYNLQRIPRKVYERHPY